MPTVRVITYNVYYSWFKFDSEVISSDLQKLRCLHLVFPFSFRSRLYLNFCKPLPVFPHYHILSNYLETLTRVDIAAYISSRGKLTSDRANFLFPPPSKHGIAPHISKSINATSGGYPAESTSNNLTAEEVNCQRTNPDNSIHPYTRECSFY